MTLVVLSALVTCVAALCLGQAAMRICGAAGWTWLSSPVGLAIVMLLALTARYVPGRATSTAVVIGLLTVASFVWCFRVPAYRPPLLGLGAAAPVALFVLVPFLAVGRGGTLGVGVDNDMSEHLPYVEAIISKAVGRTTPLQASYPVGPHAVVGAISAGLGIRADLAFAGFTLAVPVLLAWTALHALRRPTWLGQLAIASVVGLPYLVAAYYGEGSFKELVMAQLVVGLALWLERPEPSRSLWMCAPLALLVAGMVAVYSGPGLLWPAALIGWWVLGRAAIFIRRVGVRGVAAELRRKAVWVVVALGVSAAVIAPELSVLENSRDLFHDRTSLGNLIGQLPGWEAFGVWDSADFRHKASHAFVWWTAFVVVLVAYGVVWSIRRGRWMLPSAAGASALIWVYSTHYESPYLSAKALVILSPLLLALAALPFAERPERMSFRWWGPSSLLALFLMFLVGASDLRALRSSPVGPTAHTAELRALRQDLHGRPTLFIGNDDFIRWELAGVRVTVPVYISYEVIPPPEQKAWWFGRALDIDSVSAGVINANAWVITSRDAAQSQPPRQLRLVRTTPDYELWHRVGVVPTRQILNEGQDPGATLVCTPAVRRLLNSDGLAAVRQPPVTYSPIDPLPPGRTTTISLALSPGTWDLVTPYQSPVPVTVSGPGGVLRTLPANLDRPGQRWPIGRVVVPKSGVVTLTIHASKEWLTPATDTAGLGSIVAVPVGTERVIPLRQACGKYVDWYTNPVPISRRGSQVTEISSFPSDLENPAVQAVGIYSDGWVEQDAQLVLAGGPATNLSIDGQAVYLVGSAQELTLKINGATIATKTISSQSMFQLKIPIPASAGDRHISLHFAHTGSIGANDPRQAAIRLTLLGLTS